MRGSSLARVDADGVTTYDWDDGVRNMCCVGQGRPGEFVVAPDGSLWITAQGANACNSRLLHFDGSTWVESGQCAGNIDVAPDGALWFMGYSPRLGPGLYVVHRRSRAVAETAARERPTGDRAMP